MSDYLGQVLAALDERGGRTTGDVAKQCHPQFGHSTRTHAAFIRTVLLRLEAQGFVRRMDDQKPVCWLRCSAGNAGVPPSFNDQEEQPR